MLLLYRVYSLKLERRLFKIKHVGSGMTEKGQMSSQKAENVISKDKAEKPCALPRFFGADREPMLADLLHTASRDAFIRADWTERCLQRGPTLTIADRV